MRRRFRDWISLLEVAYELDGDENSWLKRLLSRSAPLLERGLWPSAMTYRHTPDRVDIDRFETMGPRRLLQWVRKSTEEHPLAVDLMYRGETAVATLSEAVFPRVPERRHAVRWMTLGVLSDILGIKAHTGEGSGLLLFSGFPRWTRTTADERRHWSMVASHLGAGLRLRRSVGRVAIESENVEAVFDPSGSARHLRGEACVPELRVRLREAVRTIERLRGGGERDRPEKVLPLWQGLVEGRWSLIDRFDSDGRRFVLAVRNEAGRDDPRGLTARERQVAEYTGLGYSVKAIAYTLGLSSAAVSNCTARVLCKLGLASRVELAAFFAPNGVRARLRTASVAGEELLVGCCAPFVTPRLAALTESERDVLDDLLRGSTNRDIASRRGSSERTVANQIQSIFRKFEVRSRAELAAGLLRDTADPTPRTATGELRQIRSAPRVAG